MDGYTNGSSQPHHTTASTVSSQNRTPGNPPTVVCQSPNLAAQSSLSRITTSFQSHVYPSVSTGTPQPMFSLDQSQSLLAAQSHAAQAKTSQSTAASSHTCFTTTALDMVSQPLSCTSSTHVKRKRPSEHPSTVKRAKTSPSASQTISDVIDLTSSPSDTYLPTRRSYSCKAGKHHTRVLSLAVQPTYSEVEPFPYTSENRIADDVIDLTDFDETPSHSQTAHSSLSLSFQTSRKRVSPECTSHKQVKFAKIVDSEVESTSDHLPAAAISSHGSDPTSKLTCFPSREHLHTHDTHSSRQQFQQHHSDHDSTFTSSLHQLTSNTHTALTMQDLSALQAVLCTIAFDWRNIGIQLGFDPGVLEGINRKVLGNPIEALTEVLTMWLRRQNPPPSLEALADVIRGPVIKNEAVANSLPQIQRSTSHQQQSLPRASSTDVIAEYADHMRGYYRTSIPQCFSLTWPPPPTLKVFNLAMISRRQHNYGRGNDELVKLLCVGKVDEVMIKEANVKLKDLFHLNEARRKVVLIEGAPGAGKSTLAWHICQMWEAGELFQEFKLVVFVQLRDPAIQSAKTLADLFPSRSKSIARDIVSRLESTDGRDLLVVLDGWDEFAPGLHGNKLFRDLICNPSTVGMHSSTLLITSRPIASGNLHKFASSRVEAIGFKQAEVNLYFKEALEYDSDKVEELEDCLMERPVIKASCYLPLNTVIVAHLFLSLDYRLPTTLHEIFLQLVIHCIVRHIVREQADDDEPPHISSLDDLPPDMQVQLSHICAMAYHGVMENKVTFSEDDLKAFNIPQDISTLSLIQGVESFMPYRSRSYNFLHLSAQELLTSYHISKLPPEEQVKIFKDLFGKPRFATVFQHYAAFTKLQTVGIRDIIVNIIQKVDEHLFLTLLHCLYEAQDSSLCQFVAFQLNGELDLSNQSLSPVDCIAIGYFLHQCATICPMTAKLSKGPLDSYQLELLGKELQRPIQTIDEVEPKKFKLCIDISFDGYVYREMLTVRKSVPNRHLKVDGKFTQCIATHLTASIINKLVLSRNPIQNAEDGLSHLCQALTNNTSLEKLNLSDCELTITEENGQSVGDMLKTNKTLKVFTLSQNSIDGHGMHYLSNGISSSAICKLDLSGNPIQDGEDGLLHLCQALATNTALVKLNLSDCELTITEENGQSMGDMLKKNKTLKVFTLSQNSIDGHGMHYLSNGISSSAICKLDLSGNPIQDGEDGLLHLCQALATNTALVKLNLSDCELTITEENGQVLSHMLTTNKTLKSLEISPLVNTNGRGLRYLSEGISSSIAISILDVSGNPIQDGEDGFFHLCQALTTNTSLMELNLSDCELTFTEQNGQALSHMLRTNKKLKSLNLLPIAHIDGHGLRYFSDYIKSTLHAIKKLDLSGNPIQDGEDGLPHLCQALTTNTSLVELNLSNCKLKITEENGQALSHMLTTNKTLKSLEISPLVNTNGCGLRYLSEGISSSIAISKLDLSGNPIQDGEDGLSHLCQALTTNTSLVELKFSGFKLSVPGRRHGEMAKAIKLLQLSNEHVDGYRVYFVSYFISSSSAISKLDLSGNPIQDGADGLSHLCQALTANTSLVELNLSNCKLKITEENGQSLRHMLKTNKKLKVFALSQNCIDGHGMRYFSNGISSSAINKLDLSGNPIQDGADGLSHLCQALTTNTSLVELNLSDCELAITEENGQALSHMLEKNKTTEVLMLSLNIIDGHAMHYLSNGISTSAIRKLDISGNPIQYGEDGLLHLCQALATNTYLVELNMSGCELTITEENGQVLSHMLKTNTTLKSLSLLPIAHIDGHGLRYFSEYIKSSLHAIKKLDLSGNPIQDGEDGLLHLCQALTTNTSLVELNLSNCKLKITEENGQALSYMLTTNKTLKSLEISPLVNTNGRGLRYLSEGISSSLAISKLDLSGNPIQDGEDGLSHLCQALTTNTSLVELKFPGFKICVPGRRHGEMAEAIKSLQLSNKHVNGYRVYFVSYFISSSSAISKLDLSGNPIQDGADGLSHLCQALTANTSLVELNLSGCRLTITEENGQSLRHMLETNKKLKVFALSQNSIDGHGMHYLSNGISTSAIRKLDISGNPIQDGEDGLLHLCQALATNTSLVELNMSTCELTITEENGQALCHMLKTNTTLKLLNLLPIAHIDGHGLRYFSEYIKSSLHAISKLDLSSNPIQVGEDGLLHLCQALAANTSLVELNLSNCELTITEGNGQALSHMLKTNKTLKSLNLLPIEHIDGHGLRYFSDYIKSTLHAIKKLDLSGNPIQDGEDGLSHLCQALTTNTSLVELNLSICKLTITKENGQALSHMMRTNKTLKSLEISPLVDTNGCGIRYLSEGIRSSSIISKLDLSGNPIQDGEDGLSHLCQALTTSTSLVELNLSDCGLTIAEENGQPLRHMLKTNKTLKVFTLSQNSIDGHGMHYLSNGISSSAVSKLDLSGNPIQDGEDGLSHLCQALTTNTSLVELKFSGFKICVPGGRGGKMAEAIKSLQLSSEHVDGYRVYFVSYFISSSSAICKLDLSGNPIQDGEDGLLHLCQALTTNTSLVELNLSNCKLKITEENSRALSHMLTTNKTTKVLTLSQNSIDGHGIHYLSNGISSSAISKLDLSGNPIQDVEDGLSHLCQALTTNTSLVELNLSNCKLTIAGENGQNLSHMLKTNKTIMVFTLSHNTINGQGILHLTEGISSSAISNLDLSDNPIEDGEDGFSHLCQALATNTALVKLTKCSLTITQEKGQILSHMLKSNKTMKALTLSHNTIGYGFSEGINSSKIIKLDLSPGIPMDGLSHLCQALTTNTSLVELNLSNCSLDDACGPALFHMLVTNRTLTSLDLSGNSSISDDDVTCIANGLRSNHSLKCLKLGQCYKHYAGMKIADSLMVNDTLEELQLSGNTISPEAACDFSDMLKNNRTLKKLDVSWCGLRDVAVESLASALEVNSTLEELDLSGNSNLTDTALVALGESLKRNTGLKVLRRVIKIGDRTTDSGWWLFVECLCDNRSLEVLKTHHYKLYVEEVNIVRRKNNFPELRHEYW